MDGEGVDTVQVFTMEDVNIGQRMWEMGCCGLVVEGPGMYGGLVECEMG